MGCRVFVFWLTVAFIYLEDTAGHAQEARVRSGAHDGFSRLAIDMPSRVSWSLSGDGAARQISFETAGIRVDTSKVFDKLNGDRLASVASLPDGRGLKLAMKCACEVDVFWHGAAMLVIDIRDPRPDTVAQGATAGPIPKPEAADFDQWSFRSVPSLLPQEQGMPAATSTAAHLAARHFQGQAEVVDGEGNFLIQPDLEDARQALALEIARAASLGLVTARDVSKPTPAGKPAVQQESVAQEEVDRPIDISPEPSPVSDWSNVNLHTQTSADQNVLSRSEKENQTAQGAACVPAKLLAVASWGSEESFAAQIGPARTRLTAEFDRADPAAALQLAKLYLYFGFGAEARHILRTDQSSSAEVQLAIAMAQILEHGHAKGSVLHGQLECDSDAALWSALSYKVLPANLAINTDAVLRGLSALPRNLRRFLGPQLMRKFTAAGKSKAAERILRILDRSPDVTTTGHTLAAAELEIASGDVVLSEAALEEVVNANTETSGEALVRRIDARLQTGRAVPRDLADLAGAYAHEQRETATGHDLARVFIQATAASGDFDGAFFEIGRLFPELPQEMQDDVIDTVLDLMIENADDVTFLRYSAHIAASKDHDLTPRIGNDIARRILGLGFVEGARPFLRAAVSGADLRDRRMLRAQMALAKRAPRQALVDLLGLEGADVNIHRARARSQLGEHRAAHLLYLSAGQTDAALREALLAEDWTEAEAIADSEFSDLLSLGARESVIETPTGVLARNRALLEASASAREEVESLLAVQTIPAATEG